MKAIYRTPFFRTDVAAKYLKDSLASVIYCFIGREDDPKGVKRDGSIFAAGDGQWLINENDPPNPMNTHDHDNELWDFAIGAKKLSSFDITFALNRFVSDGAAGSRLWSDHVEDNDSEYNGLSRIFTPIDSSSSNGEFIEERNCVIVNEDREVFLCVERIDDGTDISATHSLPLSGIKTPRLSSHSSLIEVDARDGTRSIIAIDMDSERASSSTPRGTNHYVWKYICTINNNLWINFITPQSAWIPINYDVSASASGHVDADTQDDDSVRLGGNSPYILGLRYVIFRCFLDSSDVPGSGMPYGLNFRQTWFVKDVLDATENLATFEYGYMPNSVSSMSPPLDSGYADATHGINTIDSFTKYSGSIFYVEHRPPVFRQGDQTEEIFVVFSY